MDRPERPMARPRSISEDLALERALRLFWQRGYDRASVADLGKAMGMGPSSLYNAFGSKIELFRRAMDHYLERYTGFVGEVTAKVADLGVEPTVRELLHRASELYADTETPLGCAMLQGGGAGGSEGSDGAEHAKALRLELEASLRELFEKAPDPDRLTATPEVLARFILGTMRGLAQSACDGREPRAAVGDRRSRGAQLCMSGLRFSRVSRPQKHQGFVAIDQESDAFAGHDPGEAEGPQRDGLGPERDAQA